MNKSYTETLLGIMANHGKNMGKEIENAFPSDLGAMHVRRDTMLDAVKMRCKDWEFEKSEIDAKDYSHAFKTFVKRINDAVSKYQNELLDFLVLHEDKLTPDGKEDLKVPENIAKFLKFAKAEIDSQQQRVQILHGMDFEKVSQVDE